jgi:hypothetical protein
VAMYDDETEQVIADFGDAVNMTPSELRDWLDTDESRAVGQKPDGGGESTGHASGRRILAIEDKQKADYTDDDIAHMRRVVGYVNRHLAQEPDGDVEDTSWRYSLMNWGHDPLKS